MVGSPQYLTLWRILLSWGSGQRVQKKQPQSVWLRSIHHQMGNHFPRSSCESLVSHEQRLELWLSFPGREFKLHCMWQTVYVWCLFLYYVMVVPVWHRCPPLFLSQNIYPPCPSHAHSPPQKSVPFPLNLCGLLSRAMRTRLSVVEPCILERLFGLPDVKVCALLTIPWLHKQHC